MAMRRGTRYGLERRLCPDGRCVGLIGDDGRCRECRRQVPAPAPDWVDEGIPLEGLMCQDDACFGITQVVSTGSPYRPEFERVCPLCGRRYETAALTRP